MSHRFFSSTPVAGDSATLDGAEAHHLLHVMRAGVGAEVVLFDDSGAEFDARVALLGRSEVRLEVLARREVDRELPRPLTLAVALPKGDRQRWLVEKATELGVTRLVPLAARRGVAQPEPKTLDKLRRAVIEACKQCGRNRLMAIDEPLPLVQFVRLVPETSARLLAHPGAAPVTAAHLADAQLEVVFAVGPEGGFDDDELSAALSAGWTPIGLGPRILRVETAALALVALAALGCEAEAANSS